VNANTPRVTASRKGAMLTDKVFREDFEEMLSRDTGYHHDANTGYSIVIK